MYITVRLLNGFAQELTYKIPDIWDSSNLEYALVKVPLQKRTELAYVTSVFATLPSHTTFAVREVLAKDLLPTDDAYTPFIKKLCAYYALEPGMMYKRLQKFLTEKEVAEEEHSGQEQVFIENSVNLTDEQQVVVDSIASFVTTPSYQPIVLHGVTGSGKTEVYKKLIQQALNEHKSCLFLLPEVSLAVQFTKLFQTAFPTASIFGFHSATSISDKRALWQALMHKTPTLIIGVHLPLLLPIANLGLIIVDEEHDVGYQEKKFPRIHSKEAAIMRAHIAHIPIVLGSATPAISSLHNVATRDWKFFQLKRRFKGAFPKVELIKFTREEKRPNFWISKKLYSAIADRLAKKEQAIIFLNRRGYSFFVQCLSCEFIFTCTTCSVSLTLHDNNELRCHYCGFNQQLPPTCPQCKVNDKQFLKKGIGTQQVVAILEKLFPQARIARVDMDATINKKKWHATLTDFKENKIDILVGTQTITKGFHFPNVTLIGILWADCNLNFPAYNAAEVTLQQLVQVAGRAGRERDESLVIVQTFIDHPIFKYLNEIDYIDYSNHELEKRTLMLYPPFMRFAEIELRHTDERVLEREAVAYAEELSSCADKKALSAVILGPAQPPVFKIKNIFMQRIYIKSMQMSDIYALCGSIDQSKFTSSIFFTPNPVT